MLHTDTGRNGDFVKGVIMKFPYVEFAGKFLPIVPIKDVDLLFSHKVQF